MKFALVDEVAASLSVHANTVRAWYHSGELVSVRQHPWVKIPFSSIDGLIANHYHGEKRLPPTFQELWDKKEHILTSQQVATRLGCGIRNLEYVKQIGAVDYLQFNKLVRYIGSTVDAEVKRRKKFNSRHLERILCLSRRGVLEVIRSGRLRVKRRGEKGGRYEVDMESLYYLLTQLLPGYVRPQDWINDSLSANAPAIPVNHVPGVSRHYVVPRLRKLELPYIRTINGEYRLPAYTVQAVLANDIPALTIPEIAFLFDVELRQASSWVMHGTLFCDEHRTQPNRCLRPPCLRRYIHAHSNGVGESEWYARRTRDKEHLTDMYRLSALAPYRERDVARGIATRKLVGVKLPGISQWRFLHGDAAAFLRRL